MAKRSTPSTRKPAKKTAAATKAPAKKAAAAKGAAGKKAVKAASKKAPAKKAAPARAARKAAPAGKPAPAKKAPAAKKAAPARKPVAKKAAPPRAAAPARKPAPAKKPGRARRAAAAVKSAARAVAAVVGAPVKAVAAVVAGPVVETPLEERGVIEPVEEEPHDGSNGVDGRAGGDDDEVSEASLEEAGEAGSADPESLIDRLESAYGVNLPERYLRFLRDGEYQRYPRIELAGYIRGPYDLDFVDELLPDVAELGQNAGIYDMDDVPWREDYAGYLPLASLSHPEVDEPKVFLVHQVAGDQHRVLLFDYEGWRLYPLADSFDAFLAGLPRANNDISTAFRPGA